MARYPAAAWRPLPQNATQPSITPTQAILHTAVASASSLFGWFSSPAAKGAESHFYVQEHGGVEQYIDTTKRADAQWTGNTHGVSVETWDNLDPAHTPWTAEQVAALVALLVWLCKTHDIPARICRTPDDPGIGWHEQFATWNQSSHDCPGSLREAQIPAIVAAVAAQLNGAPSTLGGLFMALSDAEQKELLDNTRSLLAGNYGETPNYKAGDLTWLGSRLNAQTAALVAAMHGIVVAPAEVDVDALAASLKGAVAAEVLAELKAKL